MTRDVVSLHGLRFHTRIGVLPHEAEIAQPLEVDVAAQVARGGQELRLDYRLLFHAVDDAVRDGEPHTVLERLAEEIATRALALGTVEHVRVAVRKPHVSLPGPLAFAEVAIERSR